MASEAELTDRIQRIKAALLTPRLSGFSGNLSGGPPVPSAPVGSVRGVNLVREDGRYHHAEGIRPDGRRGRE